MDEAMRIYVDRLHNQNVEQIDERVAAGFLDVDEPDLQFSDPVHIKGEAYLAQRELILRLAISAVGVMPCAICNEPTSVPIQVQVAESVPETSYKGGVFDMTSLVREAILLEVPLVVECHQGQCPARQEIGKYLKEKKDSDRESEKFRPFADLDRE